MASAPRGHPVHQQDALGMPGQDRRHGLLDGRDVVPGAAAGHQEPERLAHESSPPIPADHESGFVPALTPAVTARTVQGMVRVGSGQAMASPLSSDRSVRRGSGVKRDFACTFTRHRSPVLVALRLQSRLRQEGRARTFSGPCPDLSRAQTLALSCRYEDLLTRRGSQRGRVPLQRSITSSDSSKATRPSHLAVSPR
jgi:hypothetical protein